MMSQEILKHCGTCEVYKPLEDFVAKVHRTLGIKHDKTCRVCRTFKQKNTIAFKRLLKEKGYTELDGPFALMKSKGLIFDLKKINEIT